MDEKGIGLDEAKKKIEEVFAPIIGQMPVPRADLIDYSNRMKAYLKKLIGVIKDAAEATGATVDRLEADVEALKAEIARLKERTQ